MRDSIILLVLFLTGLFLATVFATSAHAHKVFVFASAEGDIIKGQAYFPGGGKAQNCKIEVFGADGRKLGETSTDTQGEFSFQAKFRTDHKFVVNTGEGHVASYLLSAEELPESLPTPGKSEAAARGNTASGGSGSAERKGTSSGASSESIPPKLLSPVSESETELMNMVERVVSRQVRPLREQLSSYEEKVRMHDILGGIGYIVGLMGIVLYLRASTRKNRITTGSKGQDGKR
jgi:nickel transport protein